MINLGTVNEDSTIRFYYATAAADGGEEDFSATLEQEDVVIHKDGSAMTLNANTITPSNVATGLQRITIDLANDSDFTTGSTYWVMVDPNDETIDSQAVSGVLGVFQIESASDKAVRLMREFLYPTDSEISTTTGNDTTTINLTDVVDAQTPDEAVIGLILAAHDDTDDRVETVVVTASSSLQATVQRLGDGSAMSFTVASGDHVWRVDHSDLGDDGTHLSEAGGDGDHLTEAGGDGDHLDAVPWNSAWDAEVQSEAQDALDDTLTFTKTDELDVNALSINGVTITGDGSTTPFDV